MKLSMLDLVSIREGGTAGQAIEIAKRTIQHAERLGFQRYWVAEHHNMTGVASSSPAVLVGHLAGATTRIRVGSGGVMLPNHAPLVVAEAFGTLAEIYPDRIDLGLGRAPGTDQITLRALRRDRFEGEHDFPREVAELQYYLGDPRPGYSTMAIPGAGTHVPIWLLGSSLYSAQLAAQMGLPFAFAAHFAPRLLAEAVHLYKGTFQASDALKKPYLAIAVPVIAAPTDSEAEFLASSTYQRVLGILTNRRGKLGPPVEGFMDSLDGRARSAIYEWLEQRVIGGPETIRTRFEQLQSEFDPDELIVVSDVFDVSLRLQSLTIAQEAIQELSTENIA